MKKITYVLLTLTLILSACSKQEMDTQDRLHGQVWKYQELEAIQEDAPCFILEDGIPLENTSIDMYLDESEAWSWFRKWRYSTSTTTDKNGKFTVLKPTKKSQFRIKDEEYELCEIGCNGSSNMNSSTKYLVAIKKKKIQVNLTFINIEANDAIAITFANDLNQNQNHWHTFEEAAPSTRKISFSENIVERVNYKVRVKLNGELLETFSYYSSSDDDGIEKSIVLRTL